MTSFQLTISPTYVSNWGVLEGVREIIQNALDAAQDGHPYTITHKGDTLTIASQGVRLQRSVWLMGTTSKADGSYRGHFGEGLKLGILAMVRADRRVSIINDDERWTASLELSEAFGEPVLTVSTRALSSGRGGFVVELEVSESEWALYRPRFLDLVSAGEVVNTDLTEILMDPRMRGQCFVKGILVETKPELAAGYNFMAATTDRDRNMVYGFDFDYYTGIAWCEAFKQGAVDAGFIYQLLMSATKDAEGLSSRNSYDTMVDAVAEVFAAEHGCDAVPVTCQAEVAEAGHMGRQGIVCPSTLCNFFSDHSTLSLAKLRSSGRAEVVTTYGDHELTARERAIKTLGVALIQPSAQSLEITSVEPRLEIVDFRAGDLLGTHSFDHDAGHFRIRMARRTLASLEEFVRVLIHEIAHDFGGDGDVAHERAEGLIFSRTLMRVLDGRLPREISDLAPHLIAS